MKYSNWQMPKGAPIVSIDELLEKVNHKYLVVTSGGFDPIHPGHISCIQESKKYNAILAVLVNGDQFLTAKKGRPFQDLRTRCQIVSTLQGVDYVVPYEVADDMTVSAALEEIKPLVFTKGGDRVDAKTIPEWTTCAKHGINVITGVGSPKTWSSSDFLEEWVRYKTSGVALV